MEVLTSKHWIKNFSQEQLALLEGELKVLGEDLLNYDDCITDDVKVWETSIGTVDPLEENLVQAVFTIDRLIKLKHLEYAQQSLAQVKGQLVSNQRSANPESFAPSDEEIAWVMKKTAQKELFLKLVFYLLSERLKGHEYTYSLRSGKRVVLGDKKSFSFVLGA